MLDQEKKNVYRGVLLCRVVVFCTHFSFSGWESLQPFTTNLKLLAVKYSPETASNQVSKLCDNAIPCKLENAFYFTFFGY